MGRASRNQSVRRSSSQATNCGKVGRNTSSHKTTVNILLILFVAVGGFVALRLWARPDRSTPPNTTAQLATHLEASDNLTSFTVNPATFDELLVLRGDELANVDIARMNLLCATGLPGAEDLDIEHALAQLDQCAERVRYETDQHLYKFRQTPHEYENSEGYFRMLMLVTVLQQDLGVRYNAARARDINFTRSQDLFIHGMIPHRGKTVKDTNGGTCVSMPVIYTAVARRLGYPVKLVTTKAHIFCRWDGTNHSDPSFRGVFNIEATNQGMGNFSDDYYRTWPERIDEVEVQANKHLRSLTPRQELADFLTTRGHNLLDTGRAVEAERSYALAAQLAPDVRLYRLFHADAARKARLASTMQPRRATQAATPIATTHTTIWVFT